MTIIDTILLFHRTNQKSITPEKLAKLCKKGLLEVLQILQKNNLSPECYGKKGELITAQVMQHFRKLRTSFVYNRHPRWYNLYTIDYGTVSVKPLTAKTAGELKHLYKSYTGGGIGDSWSSIELLATPANLEEMHKLGWMLWEGIPKSELSDDQIYCLWIES